jgi:hypothetical protein
MGSQKAILSGRYQRMALAPLALLLAVLLSGGAALGSVTASIAGTVKDATGAVVTGATVTATNVDTGIAQSMRTNEQGYYSFQSLALGRYAIDVAQTGFTPFHETGVVLDVNAALVVDVVMQIGGVRQEITVSSSVVHVESTNTQMGDVIAAQNITEVPLVSRSYTDLLALQPGVSSIASGIGGGGGGAANSGPNFQAAGFVMTPVSGSLDAGNLSVNGMRESANGFLLNGAVVQESGFGGTAVIPDLDSIAEFRILTNNFDAEYGNYSGGQINVITKSGTNQFHGDLFEFLRNTDLDSRNYFDIPNRGSYLQNQFGGTIGGPIKHDKVFFFGDYQGNRVVQGISSGLVPVPSVAERSGDFSQVLNPAGQNEMSGMTVEGAAWASQLSSDLGYPVAAGENYYTPGCTTANCVFPNAQIPRGIFSPISQNIYGYGVIPLPNANVAGESYYTTSAFKSRVRDDKASGRIDTNSRFGMLFGYYFFDDYSLQSPYTASSTLPGFGTLSPGRTQAINVGDTKTMGNAAVNEARFEYVRSRNDTNASGGTGVTTLSALGFTGVTALDPSTQGIMPLTFNNFALGILPRSIGFTESTYQGLDNYRKVVGTHTVSIGADYHYNKILETLDNTEDGEYQFFGTETGIDFADFLLGAPTYYEQGQAFPGNGRSQYFGLYAQDSWRAASKLTLNYGLRWEVNSPWYDTHNQLEAIVPGQQSRVYPNAPAGWDFPGDPGVPRTIAPTHYNNFSPRIGLAYSPGGGNGWFGKLTGAGQTSIRAGYGVFFTTFDGSSNFDDMGDAPFGDYVVFYNPVFANPFENRSNGGPPAPNPFPAQYPVPKSINFANAGFIPIGSSPTFNTHNRLPYAEEYDLSIQRQLSSTMLLTASYVGTQGHRLLASLEANPGSASICEYLNAVGATPTCGPNGESTAYVLPSGVAPPPGSASIVSGNTVYGTRTGLGSNFTTDSWAMTNGQSWYNSLQVNLRRTAKGLTFLAGYTFSKSLDNASSWAEQENPFESAKLARALSAFNQTHNFVFNYAYNLPFDKLGGPKRLTGGWQLSGILHFASGVPVTLYETDDNSLLGTAFAGALPIGVDTPVFTGSSIHRENARATGNYFDPTQFVAEPIGTLGSSRRFFGGPGLNNWDMALLKDTTITERMRLEFRAEFFNIFNHAQFNAVNGNINNSTFGTVLSAQPPRIGQLSMKFYF